MSYNVTRDTESDSLSSSFMDVGIHEDVMMTNIEYKVTDKGNEFLAFYFVNPEGETLSHTEWKPKSESVERVENQIRRIKQIVTTFIPKDNYIFKAETFEEFAKMTVKLLGDFYKGKKIRIKVVYSDTGYTSLPQYWKFKFIESIDVTSEKSKIKMLSIDKVTREPKPDVENTTSNPIEEKVSERPSLRVSLNVDTPKDDLPF
jgi:hypothetical protein